MYRAMAKRPPNRAITVQSASAKTHFRPNHKASTSTAPETRVSRVLYQLLNRLACSQPMTPTSERGGSMASGLVTGLEAINYLPTNWMRRLYMLPMRDQVRLMAR